MILHAIVLATATLVKSPAPVHRFYDKSAKIELLVDGALAGFDMGQTCHNLATGGVEYWLTQNCGANVGITVGILAGQEGLAYVLHRLGRHKLERFVRLYSAQDNLQGIVRSKQHGAW